MVPFLQADFPGSSHVALLGLERAADRTIWERAKAENFVIVTGDADFEELSVILGAPPHVVRLTGGNSSRAAVLALLTKHAASIRDSIEKDCRACVEIVKVKAD
jgi:predicted nuclease of predicted toxin-antitoxin system